MKKNILSLLLLAGMFSAANAQTYKGRVGVNTTDPASTMDIVGVPADDTVTDGLIAPHLTGDELKAKDALYTSAQTGALVYATAAVGTSSTKTANVTSAGYYWFDGSVWVKAGGAAAAAAGTPFKLQSDDTDAQSDKTNQIYRDGYVQVGVTSTNKATANSNYKTTALTAYANTTDMDATAAASGNVTGTYSASINPAGKTAGAVYGAANIAESRGTTDYITGTVSRANLHGTATMPQTWNQIIGHMINAGQTTASRIEGAIYGTSTSVNGGAGARGLFGSANTVTTTSADSGASDVMIGYTTSIQPGGSATYNEVVGVKALVSNSGTGIIANHIGGDFTAAEKNTTTVTTQPLLIGVKASAEISNLAKTKVTNMYGLKAESNFKTAAAANTITNNYGGHFSINSPAGLSSTNAYGVYIGAIEGAGNSYGVYSASTSWNVFGGTVYAPNWATTSDARLKRNIANLDNGVSTIMKLRPVSYEKKSSLKSNDYSNKEVGFIAQEVQKIMPETVSEVKLENGDKILGVNYTELIPVLTKAIQEQQKQIDELKKEVTELKAKVGR